MMHFLSIFGLFFRVGLLSFGGMTAVPILQYELVGRHYLTFQQSVDLLALSQVTPGPFSINIAAYAGMQAAGLPGACAAILGILAPSILLSLFVVRFFFRMNAHPAVQSALYGIRPAALGATTGSFLAVLFTILFSAELGAAGALSSLSFDGPVFLIFGVSSALLLKSKPPPLLLALAAGAAGAIFLH